MNIIQFLTFLECSFGYFCNYLWNRKLKKRTEAFKCVLFNLLNIFWAFEFNWYKWKTFSEKTLFIDFHFMWNFDIFQMRTIHKCFQLCQFQEEDRLLSKNKNKRKLSHQVFFGILNLLIEELQKEYIPISRKQWGNLISLRFVHDLKQSLFYNFNYNIFEWNVAFKNWITNSFNVRKINSFEWSAVSKCIIINNSNCFQVFKYL